MKIHEDPWKSIKLEADRLNKSRKINEHPRKTRETLVKIHQARGRQAQQFKKNNSKYSLSSMLKVEEFNKEFKASLPENEFDSIGGFVFGLFGRIPQLRESVTHDNFKFTVEEIEGPRILKIIMEKKIDAEKNLELNKKSYNLLS